MPHSSATLPPTMRWMTMALLDSSMPEGLIYPMIRHRYIVLPMKPIARIIHSHVFRARYNIRHRWSARNLVKSPERMVHLASRRTSGSRPVLVLRGLGPVQTYDLAGLVFDSLDQLLRGVHEDVRPDAQQARSVVVDLRARNFHLDDAALLGRDPAE